MKRGVIFSMDAALALILVMVLAGAVALQYSAVEEDVGISESLRTKAEDRAMVGFYFGESGSDTLLGSTEAYGECAVVYTYDFKGLGEQGSPTPQTFCEEA